MAAQAQDGFGFESLPRGGFSDPAPKKSIADTGGVRFGATSTNAGYPPASPRWENNTRADSVWQSVQKDASCVVDQAACEGRIARFRNPPLVLGPSGQPVSILKSSRQYGYEQARRIAERLRVKWATDRNETRFYCPDTNEQTEPPPAPAELKSAVLGFLKSSKKTVQESQQLSQTVQSQLTETKHLEEELAEIAQQYVQRVETRKEAKQKPTQQVVIVQTPQTQRRRLCCGGPQRVLP